MSRMRIKARLGHHLGKIYKLSAFSSADGHPQQLSLRMDPDNPGTPGNLSFPPLSPFLPVYISYTYSPLYLYPFITPFLPAISNFLSPRISISTDVLPSVYLPASLLSAISLI